MEKKRSDVDFSIRNFEFLKSRKAVSQVLTTIILLVVILAAVTIVSNIVYGVLKGAGNSVNPEVFMVSLDIPQSPSDYNISQFITVPVHRSSGKGDITSLKFILTDNNSKTYEYDMSDISKVLQELETRNYNITYSDFSLPANVRLNNIYFVPMIKNAKGQSIPGIPSGKRSFSQQCMGSCHGCLTIGMDPLKCSDLVFPNANTANNLCSYMCGSMNNYAVCGGSAAISCSSLGPNYCSYASGKCAYTYGCSGTPTGSCSNILPPIGYTGYCNSYSSGKCKDVCSGSNTFTCSQILNPAYCFSISNSQCSLSYDSSCSGSLTAYSTGNFKSYCNKINSDTYCNSDTYSKCSYTTSNPDCTGTISGGACSYITSPSDCSALSPRCTSYSYCGGSFSSSCSGLTQSQCNYVGSSYCTYTSSGSCSYTISNPSGACYQIPQLYCTPGNTGSVCNWNPTYSYCYGSFSSSSCNQISNQGTCGYISGCSYSSPGCQGSNSIYCSNLPIGYCNSGYFSGCTTNFQCNNALNNPIQCNDFTSSNCPGPCTKAYCINATFSGLSSCSDLRGNLDPYTLNSGLCSPMGCGSYSYMSSCTGTASLSCSNVNPSYCSSAFEPCSNTCGSSGGSLSCSDLWSNVCSQVSGCSYSSTPSCISIGGTTLSCSDLGSSSMSVCSSIGCTNSYKCSASGNPTGGCSKFLTSNYQSYCNTGYTSNKCTYMN